MGFRLLCLPCKELQQIPNIELMNGGKSMRDSNHSMRKSVKPTNRIGQVRPCTYNW